MTNPGFPRRDVLDWMKETFATDTPHEGRVEHKILLPGLDEHRAMAHVRRRLPGLREAFPPRRVSSLYLDSARYSCYRQSVAGDSDRVKVRLRWYGDLRAEVPVTLELKYRASELGWKSSYPITGLDLLEADLADIAAACEGAVSPAERLIVARRRLPVVVTSYHRQYLASSDGAIRVTVDTELRCHDQRRGHRLNVGRDDVNARFAVLECKFHRADGDRVRRVMGALGTRRERFSKYCFAVARLTPNAR